MIFIKEQSNLGQISLCLSEFVPVCNISGMELLPYILLTEFKSCALHLKCKLSVHFSCSVMSDSLWPHELQHARPPCLSPTPGAYSNSCPLSWWCHPTISSSVVPFFSCLHSFPASGSFQMSHLFTSGSQSIGVSASISVLPKNTQDWFPLGCLHSCKHMWPLSGLMLFKNFLLLKKIL